jgi:hypothetical protein
MERICTCGCGAKTAGGAFLPGHDQKLRADVERRAGGLVAMSKLVSAAEIFLSGQLSLEAFGAQARSLLSRGR